MKNRQHQRSNPHEWTLFAVLLLAFSYFYQGGFSNQASRFNLALALGFEHTLTIDTWQRNTIDKVHVGGHFFSEKAPLATYLTVPLTWASAQTITADEIKMQPAIADRLHYVATVLTVAFLSALSAVFFRRLILFLNPSLNPAWATLWALLVYLGTPIWAYSTMLFGHQLAGSLLIMGLYFLVTSHGNLKSWFCGSLLLALSVFAEYPVAVLAIGSFLTVCLLRSEIIRERPSFIIWSGIAGLIAAMALAAHNFTSFGSPFKLGYGQLQGSIFASGMDQGFFGISMPRGDALLELVGGFYRGILVYAPILVLAVVGWMHFYLQADGERKLRLAFVPLLVALLLHLMINSSYAFWQGGACFGPRHLVPGIGLFALGLAFVPKRIAHSPLAAVLFIVSFAINLLGVAITPFLSEFIRSPLILYGRLFAEGRVSLNPMAYLTPVQEASLRWRHPASYADASWNLGELAGLPGLWSLAPLLLLLCVYAMTLLGQLRRD